MARERSGVAPGIDVSDEFGLAEPVYALASNLKAYPVASNGNTSLLLYTYDFGAGANYLSAVRLTDAGVALDPRGIILDSANSFDPYSNAVWTGDEWLILYSKSSSVHAITLSADGEPGTPHATGLAGYPKISWGGDRALLVSYLTAVFVDGDGIPLGSVFPPLQPPTGVLDTGQPSFHDSVWLVPYTTLGPSRVYATTVLASGPTGHDTMLRDTIGSQVYPAAGSEWNETNGSFTVSHRGPPASCELGGSCSPQVSWCQSVTSTPEGVLSAGPASLCTGGGSTLPPLTAKLELPGLQSSPALAFDGTSYLAAWMDAGRGGVVGAHYDTLGARLEPEPFVLEAAPDRYNLLAASNQSDTLVTWGGGGKALIGSALVSPEGSVAPQAIAPPIAYFDSAALASDGEHYLVAWSAYNDGAETVSHAALLAMNGELSADVTFPKGDTEVRAAFDGTNYVLVWGAPGNVGERVLFGMRLGPALERVDADPKTLLTYPAVSVDFGPKIATANDGLILAWSEGEAPASVRTVQVSSDLSQVATPVTAGTTTWPNATVRTAFDGDAYWVTWLEQGATYHDLLASRVAADGALMDGAPLTLHSGVTAGYLMAPITAGANGQLLVAYRSSAYGAPLRARFVKSLPVSSGGAGGAGSGGTESGAAGSGGTSSGGASNGGTSSAGASNGGATNGGTSSAGASSSGATNGGTSSGSANAGEAGTGATSGGEGGQVSATGGSAGESGTSGEAGEAGAGATGGSAGTSSGQGGASGALGTAGEDGASGRSQGGSGGNAASGGEAGEAPRGGSGGSTASGGAGASAVGGTTGGTKTSGGTSGKGGGASGGRGGSGAKGGVAGKAGASSGSGGRPPGDQGAGCSCTTPTRAEHANAYWLSALLLGLTRARRARRRVSESGRPA
jgi:hypothetical protein